MNMETLIADKDEICAIVVYGIVPEFMPFFAFRREKHYKTAGTKNIKCPYCGGIFKVVEATAKLELLFYGKKARVEWHDSMLCYSCHKTVGVIYAPAMA